MTSTSPTAGTAVNIADLRKTFRRDGQPFHAVDGTSWHVARGEIVAFLGENGAGKSTTLSMLLGLTEPTSGRIEVLGTTPRAAVRAGRVGAVLQENSLPANATVSEVAHMIAATYGTPAHSVAEMLGRWDLSEIAGQKISRCSGGQLQRLRTALAVINDPDLLILDEPTAGMDVTTRARFWAAMRTQASAGRTIIFATHYLAEAEEFADRVVLISRGHIVADGSIAEIRGHGGDTHVTAEFGDSDEAEAVAARVHADALGVVLRQGSTLTISTAHSDDLARFLLNHTSASNLTVTAASLDQAFEILTETQKELS